MENTELQKAMKIVIKELKKDECYYIGWKANIAMAFYDEVTNYPVLCCDRNTHKELIHTACNKAADNFLKLLIK